MRVRRLMMDRSRFHDRRYFRNGPHSFAIEFISGSWEEKVLVNNTGNKISGCAVECELGCDELFNEITSTLRLAVLVHRFAHRGKPFISQITD